MTTEAKTQDNYEGYEEGDEGEYWEGDPEGGEQEEEQGEHDEKDEDFDQPLAFQVEGVTQQLPSEPPADAAEYLRRVQKEASALGSVKRAKDIDPDSFKHKQTSYLPKIELAMACPEAFRPDPEWEQAFAANFSAIRDSVAKVQPLELSQEPLPGLRDAKSWLYFVMGSNATLERTEEEEDEKASSSGGGAKKGESSSSAADSSASALSRESSGHLPVLSLLCRFDQVTIRMLIELLTRTDFTSTFGYHLCVWLFALLAQLDKPLNDDMSFVLRNLFRKLSRTRASQKKEGNIVAYCNMLLTIIHAVFQQSVPTEL